MRRRDLFKSMALVGIAAPITARKSSGYVPAHNWDKYDFGSGPPVRERLNQGPFPEYAPEDLYPGGDVVMTTTPAGAVVPNFGKGPIMYHSGIYVLIGVSFIASMSICFLASENSKFSIKP